MIVVCKFINVMILFLGHKQRAWPDRKRTDLGIRQI